MYLNVKVIPNSSIQKLIKIKELYYRAKIKSQPVRNKANQELIGLLSQHFQVPKNKIKILCGLNSQEKLIKIEKD